jgi:N-acetyl-gamma-glutamyl-phosphate reductase
MAHQRSCLPNAYWAADNIPMTHIFIDGAAGTTGLEIEARLAGRSGLSLIQLADTDRKDAGKRADAINAADIVILCLPDDAAREAVSLVRNPNVRIIDASTAHRTTPGWTYGFPEIGHDVAGASRISNPGCFPTGFLALVKPLVAAGLIPADWPITVHATSGYSGGGKAMIAEFETAGTTPPAWRAYALNAAHKHVPEMQMHAGLAHPPLFTPAVANTYRGMVVDVPLNLAAMPSRPSVDHLRDCLAAAYEHTPLVRLVPDYDAAVVPIVHAAGTDRMDLFVFANEDRGHIRLIAALDNLGKGASGACVQSLNLLAGLPETEGLQL